MVGHIAFIVVYSVNINNLQIADLPVIKSDLKTSGLAAKLVIIDSKWSSKCLIAACSVESVACLKAPCKKAWWVDA